MIHNMPLEKAKLRAEKKRYAAISSGMFLLMLLMIAGLAYVSWDNARKNTKLKEQDRELQASKDSLESSNKALWDKQVELERTQLALQFANLKYETFVDSIISEGDRMQKKKAMEVKSSVSHVSEEIKDNKNIREDAENIERIERELVEQAEELSQELKSQNGMAKTYALKSQTYAKLGNFKSAYKYHTLFKQMDDSLFNAEQTVIVQGLEEKYQAEQRENRNLELKAEVSENQRLLEQNKRDILEKNAQIYFLIGSVGLLILLFIVFRYGNRKRRELLQAQLETSEKEREAESLRSMISGEELERKRLARELHDGLGSHLASVKMLVEAIQNDIPEVKDSELHQKAERMLDEACQEIREISHNLMPGTISRYGLEQSIQDMCINLQQSTDLQISCMLHIDRDIDESTQVSMFRIVQELLRNTVKHAQAKELIVQVQTDPDQISLTVEDDGIGYQDSNDKSDGIGLMNVRSRVELLKGSLDIDSRPGKGTSIYICIPLLPEGE